MEVSKICKKCEGRGEGELLDGFCPACTLRLELIGAGRLKPKAPWSGNNPDGFGVEDVAQLLGVCKATVRRWCRMPEPLGSNTDKKKVGERLRITADALVEFTSKHYTMELSRGEILRWLASPSIDSPAAAAEKLGVCPMTIWRWTRDRWLGCLQVGKGDRVIKQFDLDRFERSKRG